MPGRWVITNTQNGMVVDIFPAPEESFKSFKRWWKQSLWHRRGYYCHRYEDREIWHSDDRTCDD